MLFFFVHNHCRRFSKNKVLKTQINIYKCITNKNAYLYNIDKMAYDYKMFLKQK